MLAWFRRNATTILTVWMILPFVIFWLDDILTNWHHHGTESLRVIAWENFLEDAVVIGCILIWRMLLRPRIGRVGVYHCTCPHCGFAWACAPEDIPDRCPHCSRADAPRIDLTGNSEVAP